MRWQGAGISQQPIQVGPLLVRRVPSSFARYCVRHKHSWRGYLFPQTLPSEALHDVGKLIDVRSEQELDDASKAYRASLELGASTRLTYYAVVDVSAEG